MENKRPIIIDCDPGTDDAICIMMLFADDNLDVLGITPVCGNKPLAHCEKNALMLCELAGRVDVPVFKGARKAVFVEERTAGDIHGATGLGGIVLPEPKKQLEDKYAWDFIYEKAVELKGELEIIAVGPLSNLGTALLKYPDLPKYVKQIVIMGGAQGQGNTTPAAEFNIWADPHAAKIVFKSGIPMVMLGLDICQASYITAEESEEVKAFSGKVPDVLGQLIDRGLEHSKHRGAPGATPPDAVAAAYLRNPELFTCLDVHVDVECNGLRTEGKTVVTYENTEHLRHEPNTILPVEIDRDAYGRMIVETARKLSE